MEKGLEAAKAKLEALVQKVEDFETQIRKEEKWELQKQLEARKHEVERYRKIRDNKLEELDKFQKKISQ